MGALTAFLSQTCLLLPLYSGVQTQLSCFSLSPVAAGWSFPFPWAFDYSLNNGESLSLSRVRLFATPWTVALQAPLSHGDSPGRGLQQVAAFSLKEHLSQTRIKTRSPLLCLSRLFTTGRPWGSLSNGETEGTLKDLLLFLQGCPLPFLSSTS